MKSIMPFFAACALLAGTACSTYTSTTDPNDKGSGTSLDAEVVTTAPATEAHTAAATHETAAPVKADTAAQATDAAH